MQIAICDDNKDFLMELDRQLRALPQAKSIHSYSSLQAFLSAVADGKRYDTVLMDIDWNGQETGLDAAERLEQLSPRTRVIFVTGYNDRFSQEIFLRSSNLSGYLVKPIDERLLAANLDKAQKYVQQEEDLSLVLHSRGGILTIPFRNILYLESKGHHVKICTPAETFTVYDQLNAVQRNLPAGFYRCHKSFIVNMVHIRRFQQPDILLKNGDTIPVSRARYGQAKAAYFEYVGQTF